VHLVLERPSLVAQAVDLGFRGPPRVDSRRAGGGLGLQTDLVRGLFGPAADVGGVTFRALPDLRVGGSGGFGGWPGDGGPGPGY
jgi:hypothetical protein